MYVIHHCLFNLEQYIKCKWFITSYEQYNPSVCFIQNQVPQGVWYQSSPASRRPHQYLVGGGRRILYSHLTYNKTSEVFHRVLFNPLADYCALCMSWPPNIKRLWSLVLRPLPGTSLQQHHITKACSNHHTMGITNAPSENLDGWSHQQQQQQIPTTRAAAAINHSAHRKRH